MSGLALHHVIWIFCSPNVPQLQVCITKYHSIIVSVTTASSLLSLVLVLSLQIYCVAQMVEMIHFSEETKVCSRQMRW